MTEIRGSVTEIAGIAHMDTGDVVCEVRSVSIQGRVIRLELRPIEPATGTVTAMTTYLGNLPVRRAVTPARLHRWDTLTLTHTFTIDSVTER